MSLAIHNTLSGKKEPFVPVEEGRVKMYVCGPTVYDQSHIGHARAVVVFDVLLRHLAAKGYDITYIRNFTDVDDKIINRANEEGVDFLELADRHIREFHEDMDALGAIRPTLEPRATDNIEGMIEDIQSLVDRGMAYAVDGDVFFDVNAFPDYGKLSGRNLDEMKAGARVEVDRRKKSPLDFVLWKAAKPGEPSWPSPWGPGRPGWHIECSVMSHRLLGAEFDIHGGGHDLVFPHHENEIAQSRGLGRAFARYWMHNGFVRVDNQKMSKSLKNFFTVKEVISKFDPEVVRLFLVSKHYRSPIDFSDEALGETKRSLDRAYLALQSAQELGIGPEPTVSAADARELMDKFSEALDDDLNSAKALGYLFEAVKELNRTAEETRAGRTDQARLESFSAATRLMGRTLGVLHRVPSDYLSVGSADPDKADSLTGEQIDALVLARTEARVRRDWGEADRIRDELKAQGVVLEDRGGETRWRYES